MTSVRRFNQEGIDQFSSFLDRLQRDPQSSVEFSLLSDTLLTIEAAHTRIETQRFRTRFEAAKYLSGVLSNVRKPETDIGLWAWLSLHFFDSLCPEGLNGGRRPGDRARYIPEVNSARRYYRHLLLGPYRIYQAHQHRLGISRLVLCGPVDKPGDIVEQLASRPEIITNPHLMEVASKLFYDSGSDAPKPGATKGVRRFVSFVNQLDVTWDLYSLRVDDLLGRLPGEFDRFRRG